MSEWKEYKLGEVAEIVTGYPFPSEKYGATGKLRVVRGENVTIGKLRWDVEKHWNLDIAGLEKYLLRPDDIVVGMDGSRVGSNRALIRETDLPLILAQRVACLRAKNGFDSKYIWYTIFSDTFRKYVEAINTGTSIPHISQKQIAEFEIMCPSEAEQKRIARVLSSLDDKIDLLHRENATLEALAETLFRHYFIENPDPTWKEGKLGDEFDFTMGQSPSGDSFNEDGIGIPMYQGNADFGFRFPTRRVYTTAPTRLAEENDTLISVRAPVGAQNMASEKCCIGRGVAAFRHNDKSLYSYTYYKLKSLLEDIRQFNDNGTVFGSISKSDFENIDIVIPNRDSIVAFQEQATPLDEKIRTNYKQILVLSAQRDSLLPRLMSGEVAVVAQ